MSQSIPPTTPAAAAAVTDLTSSPGAPPPAQAEFAPPPQAASTPAALIPSALAQLEAAAGELEGQPEALLALLRSLEQLHRAIQDGPFRSSLPADRNDLFRLLSEMERSGGWPYIPRLQLRTFLDLLGQGGSGESLATEVQPGDVDAPEPDHGTSSSRLAA